MNDSSPDSPTPRQLSPLRLAGTAVVCLLVLGVALALLAVLPQP